MILDGTTGTSVFTPLRGGRFAVEGRRAKDIAAQPEQFAVHDFGVKNLVALLKSANGSHRDL